MSKSYDISIVIVNYNVRHFIVECLESFKRSKLDNLSVEVWVVDNASIDGSVDIIKDRYPDVKLIVNKDNVGFSMANNQAIRQANGKYILLLNPDTVLEEDTLKICYNYMEDHQNVGALGVKMIDGAGTFLPESKRSLPTAWNSLTKLLGLSSIFPKSKTFNGYALGALSENERHKIEVLCGAFMFMPKSALNKVGLLDERFFMYGEDIDLSYRIIKGGYEIHYIPDTTIIHYKGESTKKGSLNYVKTFYNAMGLYVDKHYSGGGASIFGSLLKLGIWTRASISATRRVFSNGLLILFDAVLISAGLYLFSQVWATYFFGDPNYYEDSTLLLNIGLYTILWVMTSWLIGYYKKQKWTKRLQSSIVGTILILGIYGLLDESYRTSRVIILVGGIISFFVHTITSVFRKSLQPKLKSKAILIVAKKERAIIINRQLEQSNIESNVVGLVYPASEEHDKNIYVNNISHLPELTKVLKADEIIFSTEDMSTKDIMKTMMDLDTRLSFKIAGDESLNILGSKSKNTSGEIYDVDLNYNLNTEYHQHIKRVFDVVIALAFLILFPLTLPINKLNLVIWFKTTWNTLLGRHTWVGYENPKTQNLPIIQNGIFKNTVGDRTYARKYSVWVDLECLMSHRFIIPK